MRAYAPKRMSRSESIRVTRQAINDLLPQMAAAWMYVLDRRGWHKDRVLKAYKDVVALYQMPEVMGKFLQGDDVVEYIAQKYGIDWDELRNAAKIADDEGRTVE